MAILMVLVVLLCVADVVLVLYEKLTSPPLFLLDLNDIFVVFASFLAVLIAIEIFANITLYLRDDVIYPSYPKTLASGRPNAFNVRQSDEGMLSTFRISLTQQWKRWGVSFGRGQMALMLPRLISIGNHPTFN